MMYPIISPYKKYYAVLKIDIFIFYSLEKKQIDQIKISNTSINRRNIDSSFRIANIINIIDELDDFLEWELFNDNTHFLDYEKRQYKSAEILIPKCVAPQYILEVCPKCTELELKKKYELSDENFSKINFKNKEFEFKHEEIPEISLAPDEEDFEFFEFNDDYDEEIEEEDDLDEWNKFNNIG